MWGWLVGLLGLVWLLARGFGGYRCAPGGLLARREMGFLEAAALALLPAGGPIPHSGSQAGIAGYVDRLVAAQPARNRLLMRLLFALMEHATLILPAPGGLSGFRRFSSLGAAQRQAVLEAWETSRLFPRRLAFSSLRALLTLGYFAHPPVLRALSVAPFAIEPPVCPADLLYPRVGASRASVDRSAADLTPPSQGEPLALDGPLMPGYDEAAS